MLHPSRHYKYLHAGYKAYLPIIHSLMYSSPCCTPSILLLFFSFCCFSFLFFPFSVKGWRPPLQFPFLTLLSFHCNVIQLYYYIIILLPLIILLLFSFFVFSFLFSPSLWKSGVPLFSFPVLLCYYTIVVLYSCTTILLYYSLFFFFSFPFFVFLFFSFHFSVKGWRPPLHLYIIT